MRRRIAQVAVVVGSVALAAGCGSDPGSDTNGIVGGATGSGATGARGGTGANGTGASSTGATGGGIPVGVGGSGGSIPIGGSAGTDGGSGGSSGTDGGSGGACTGTTATGQKGAPPTLLFLVDTSLSMNDRVGMSTKIAATRTALDQSFSTLSAALSVGLVFFPHEPIGAATCFDPTVEVPIAPLDAAQKSALTTQVDAAMADGSTPTHDAYAFAVQTLEATPSAGDKYIVLITDGEPTYALGCVGTGRAGQMPPTPTQPLIDAAAAALTSDGIKTFVVGSPGSQNARSALSAMARVGGTGPDGCSDDGPNYCHFDMTMTTDVAASLSAALGTIQEQIPIDCTFDLPTPPAGMTLDLNKVNVTVTNDDGSQNPIAHDPNDDCATEGWRYAGDPPKVQLCGSLCDAVKAQAMPSIDVQFGCTQRVNPPR